MRRMLAFGLAASLLLVAVPASAEVNEIKRDIARVATADFTGDGGHAYVSFYEVSPGSQDLPPAPDEPFLSAYYQLGDPCRFEVHLEESEYEFSWSMDHASATFDTGNPDCGVVEVTWTAIDGGWDYRDHLNMWFIGIHHVRNINYNWATASMTINGVPATHLTLNFAQIEERAVNTILK